MNFCVNCQFYVRRIGAYLQPMEHICSAPILGKDIVTGKQITMKCYDCRTNYLCGQEGKWYVPKSSNDKMDVPNLQC